MHCPLTPKTKNLFNKETFAKMKSTAILVNTSRGPVVDQDALYDALKNGKKFINFNIKIDYSIYM